MSVTASTFSVCFTGEHIQASRLDDRDRHEWTVLSISKSWLERHLADHLSQLGKQIHDLLYDERTQQKGWYEMRSMTLIEKDLVRDLLDPPASKVVHDLWYQAKVKEIVYTQLLNDNMVSERGAGVVHPKLKQIKVEQAQSWLRENITEPLDLNRLAQHLTWSPYHLSRSFKQLTGRTLSEQLRIMRADYAAELLETGSYNVTEAAMAAGYSSLSHFTKIFVREKGIKPSVYMRKRVRRA